MMKLSCVPDFFGLAICAFLQGVLRKWVIFRWFFVVNLWWLCANSWFLSGRYSTPKNTPLFWDLFLGDSHGSPWTTVAPWRGFSMG